MQSSTGFDPVTGVGTLPLPGAAVRLSRLSLPGEKFARGRLGRRLIFGLDDQLRRCEGIYAFSQDPHCLLRIARGASQKERTLADGTIIHAGDAVIEGRDIGTVVLPDADVKVYLVADTGVRARRRMAERPGIGADALATDLRLRDESDAAQMRPAPDAQTIDTTDLEVDVVVARIEELVRARQPA